MAKRLKSPTVSMLVIVLGVVLLLLFLAQTKKNAAIDEKKYFETAQIEKLEIPQFTQERTSQVIEHKGFTVSYNSDWRIPNWVAYELTKVESEGTGERARHFLPDPEVRGICPETRDYSNSGYDRGHMAPAGDMKWDEQAMRESFYLSNICPQNHNLNAGVWKSLEEKVRDWAQQYGSVYVVCGPIVSSNCSVIGSCDISVPEAFYKVLLIPMDGTYHAIGFYFENKAGTQPLKTFCKTVDEVEIMTGIDFFPQLDDNIENSIEAKFDFSFWDL
mgnify:FL=1